MKINKYIRKFKYGFVDPILNAVILKEEIVENLNYLIKKFSSEYIIANNLENILYYIKNEDYWKEFLEIKRSGISNCESFELGNNSTIIEFKIDSSYKEFIEKVNKEEEAKYGGITSFFEFIAALESKYTYDDLIETYYQNHALRKKYINKWDAKYTQLLRQRNVSPNYYDPELTRIGNEYFQEAIANIPLFGILNSTIQDVQNEHIPGVSKI